MSVQENTETKKTERLSVFITESEKNRIKQKIKEDAFMLDFFMNTEPTNVGKVDGHGNCWTIQLNSSDFNEESFKENTFYQSKNNKWVVYREDNYLFLRMNK